MQIQNVIMGTEYCLLLGWTTDDQITWLGSVRFPVSCRQHAIPFSVKLSGLGKFTSSSPESSLMLMVWNVFFIKACEIEQIHQRIAHMGLFSHEELHEKKKMPSGPLASPVAGYSGYSVISIGYRLNIGWVILPFFHLCVFLIILEQDQLKLDQTEPKILCLNVFTHAIY